MPNFHDQKEAVDFLSEFDLDLTGKHPGDFSPEFIKFSCVLKSADGKEFPTSFQFNPNYTDAPAAEDVLAAMVSDALLASEHTMDSFMDELGFDKPSKAFHAYEDCKKSLDWLHDELGLSKSDLSDLWETMDEHMEDIKEAVEEARDRKSQDEAYLNPPVPKGFTSIEDLEDGLDIGDYGDQLTEYNGCIGDAITECADSNVDIYNHDLLKWLPDNYEWVGEADFQGLLEGIKGDLIKMIQAAQYVCFSQDMYDHQEDIAKYVTLEGLKDKGVYALSDDVSDQILYGDIDFTDNNMDLSDYLDAAETVIFSAVEDAMEEATGGEVCEAAYDEVNPCAMSVKAVHLVNDKGYDAAFAEQWKDALQPSGEQGVTLRDAAKESRTSSQELEGGSPESGHEQEQERSASTTEH